MPCDYKWKVLSEPPLYTVSLDHLQNNDYLLTCSSFTKALYSSMWKKYCVLALGIKHEQNCSHLVSFLSFNNH